jgi:cytoskeletal protein RodZ
MRKIVDDSRARQGAKGRPVFLVLLGSFLLIGLYLVGMMVWSGSESPTQPSQDASRQAVSPSASSSNTSGTPSANPAYPAPASPTANPSATGSTGATNR